MVVVMLLRLVLEELYFTSASEDKESLSSFVYCCLTIVLPTKIVSHHIIALCFAM